MDQIDYLCRRVYTEDRLYNTFSNNLETESLSLTMLFTFHKQQCLSGGCSHSQLYTLHLHLCRCLASLSLQNLSNHMKRICLLACQQKFAASPMLLFYFACIKQECLTNLQRYCNRTYCHRIFLYRVLLVMTGCICLEHAGNIFNLKLIVSTYVSFVLNVFDSGQCILVKEMKIFYFYDISTISKGTICIPSSFTLTQLCIYK